MKPSVSLRAKVLLALASAAFSLGLTELLLRIGGYDLNPSPQWRYHEVYGWTSDPGGLSMAGQAVEGVLPSGFRHRVESVAKGPGVKQARRAGLEYPA
ncbi:MAG TPA: hypothetical protein VLU25_10015 [Acidobacteriota bacterium]|nr:hypothetical protein [Acidobacteriota bacterium]